MKLHALLHRAARVAPEHPAVETLDGASLSYAALAERARALATALGAHGVGRGDRVGLCAPKSPASVTAILGVLEADAAYVPVDAGGPRERAAEIFHDCGVRAILCHAPLADALLAALDAGAGTAADTAADASADAGAETRDAARDDAHDDAVPAAAPAPPAARFHHAATLDDDLALLLTDAPRAPNPDDLAYILSTSGSTGRPKGVPITHAAALSFVDWLADTFPVSAADRFSSHAPFHFDLSILDLYLPLRCGGTLVLIDEATGKQPRALAPRLAEARLTVWYSTPSILALLVEHGRLERHLEHTPRLVFFAGEVFPVRALRALTELWPDARYLNLYGPTETNVCTWYEVPTPIPAEREQPFPIGHACAHVQTAVFDEQARAVPDGEVGELCVRGAPVTAGYWQRPELSTRAFHAAPDGDWYRTGDLVRATSEGYEFLGRRDRMVKRRGHRVELGEVEARLHRHPDAREVAVLARPAPDGLRLQAFVAWRDDSAPSLLELKRFCAEHLPGAMVPDGFTALPALPRTSTDKIDYQALEGLD